MNNPLVTIAIPSYNHGKFIYFCLNSIKEEKYSNKEIVIVDDGSTDNTIEQIQVWKYNNPHIKLTLISRENKGLNATLNELIEISNGEYICLLASDDALFNNSIETRLNVFKKEPNKYVVIGDAHVIDNNNNIIMNSAISDLYNGNKANYKSDELLLYSIVNEWSIPGPVAMIRKSLYDIIGKYPTNQFAEDINFYMKIIGLKLLVFVDLPVALYRIHSNNTGGNPKYSKELSKVFILSYLRNIKYYPFKLKLRILKKIVGRIYLYLKASLLFK